MRVAICDDDRQVLEEMKQYVYTYFGGACSVDMFNSGKELLEKELQYEILFLDIEIGDINGIKLAQMIREKDKKILIVFVTNYSNYSRHAFSVHAFDYIIKPVKREQIYYVLDEIKSYRVYDKQNRFISLKSEKGIIRVKIESICYFEYVDRKIKIILDDDSFFLIATMNEIMELLGEYDFMKPHKSFIINMRKVSCINKFDIYLDNGDVIPLAQKKAAAVKKDFNEYLYRQM